MVHVHNNRVYISTFPEHVEWLIENSTHEVWIVYLHHKNKEKEKITKDNYKEICYNVQIDYANGIFPDELFMVVDLGDLTISHHTDLYNKLSVNYSSSYQFSPYKF